MRRRIFTILSALSLVLCVAMMVVWVRSHLGSDLIYYQRATHNGTPGYATIGAASRTGLVVLAYTRSTTEDSPLSMGFGHEYERYRQASLRFQRAAMSGDTLANRLGFACGWSSNPTFGEGGIWLPQWVIVLGTAILPVRWLWFYRQHRIARRKGLCLTCGYDLRASKDRCPECGTAVTTTGNKA